MPPDLSPSLAHVCTHKAPKPLTGLDLKFQFSREIKDTTFYNKSSPCRGEELTFWRNKGCCSHPSARLQLRGTGLLASGEGRSGKMRMNQLPLPIPCCAVPLEVTVCMFLKQEDHAVPAGPLASRSIHVLSSWAAAFRVLGQTRVLSTREETLHAMSRPWPAGPPTTEAPITATALPRAEPKSLASSGPQDPQTQSRMERAPLWELQLMLGPATY